MPNIRLPCRFAPSAQESDRFPPEAADECVCTQIIDETGSKVLVSASTAEKAISGSIKNGGNVEAAKIIGKAIAEKATAAGIKEIAFDRSGFRFHGRIKAVADAARENGLVF